MDSDNSAVSTRALRRSNAEAVVRYALSHGAFNASDVMSATGLTRSTVIGHCDELAELGWIEKLDDARAAGEYSKGRPARRFQLSPGAGLVVGIDAGQHSVTALVTDLQGHVHARVRRSFGTSGLDPAVRSSVILDVVETALADAGTNKEAVLVTVFGVPAPTDDAGRSPAGGGGYWLQMNPDLVNRFRSYGRVIVENDANLAAVAEGALGAGRGIRSFAALLSGERFGAGVVIDDVLLRGRHGGAGELRVLEFVEGVGSADGLASLAREWAREARLPHGPARDAPLSVLDDEVVSAEAVFESADSGDPLSVDIVDRLGNRLARVCLVLASLLDVERVVISGAIANAAKGVVFKARQVLKSDSYQPVPDIVVSSLGVDVVVLGAIQKGLTLIRDEPLSFFPAKSANARPITA